MSNTTILALLGKRFPNFHNKFKFLIQILNSNFKLLSLLKSGKGTWWTEKEIYFIELYGEER